jgi:outer membrane murein-binding lipoprotein Lpp
MDDSQKNWFMVAWPVLTAVVGMVWIAGSSSQEVAEVRKDVEIVQPLVARVAVLEAGANTTKEDLQEIKEDLAIIRDYILEKGR